MKNYLAFGPRDVNAKQRYMEKYQALHISEDIQRV